MASVLIANLWASGVDEKRLAAVRAELSEGTELRLTRAGGEATELARELSGQVDALYVFGGDGTYNEVLNGIDVKATGSGLDPCIRRVCVSLFTDIATGRCERYPRQGGTAAETRGCRRRLSPHRQRQRAEVDLPRRG